MKRHLIMFALMGAWSAPALGQTVFFDDFEGSALLPHWNQPPASYWEYNVSSSMLNVTNLFYPSHPKSPSNFTGISAAFLPQTDFRADIWMGWEAGQQPHRLEFDLMTPGFGGVLASFGYRNEGTFGSTPLIFAGTGTQSVSLPAPDAGIHLFTIARIGTEIDFFLNGSPFASFSNTPALQAGTLGFFFLGPYPGELGAFQIDRVQVVPAPGTLLVLSTSLALCSRRRRQS